jgi:hypothetical protein
VPEDRVVAPEAALIATAGLCVLIALVEAWVMVASRFWRIEAVRQRLPNYTMLVKSHVDYLMMATLLLAIYAVLAVLDARLHPVFVVCVCAGALLNPFGFIPAALGVAPSRYLWIQNHVSFVLTTVGFLGALGTLLVHA